MSVDVGESFRNGLQGTFSARGIIVGLLLLAIGLANLVVGQSISRYVMEWLFGAIMGGGPQQQQALAQAGAGYPFALDIPIPVVLALAFVLLLVGELIRLVAIRLFGSESTEPLPTDDVAEGFGSAAVKMLVLGGALSLVVQVANVVPILGQIFGWVLFLVFVYLRQVIALEDQGWFDTVSRAVELFTEEPLPIAILLLVLGVFGFAVTYGTQLLLNFAVFAGSGVAPSGSTLGNPAALTPLLSLALGVIFQVLGIAVVTDAYKQARATVDEDSF